MFRKAAAFLALGTVSIRANEEAPIDATLAEPEKVQKPESESYSPVLQLTGENFHEKIKDTKFALVKFYAPWCGHCKKMAPAYEEAARLIALDENLQAPQVGGVALYKVEASEEQALSQEFEIQGYPSIQWFVGGKKTAEFTGDRSTENIVSWIKEAVVTLHTVETEEALKTLLDARPQHQGVMVFQGPKDNAEMEKIAEAIAESGESTASTKVVYFRDATAKETAVILHIGLNEQVAATGELTKEALLTWLKDARVPKFGQIDESNFEIYLPKVSKGMLWVCLSKDKLKEEVAQVTPALVGAAEAQNGEEKYPMVWLDTEAFADHAQKELGCTSFPTIVLQKGDLLNEEEDPAKVEKVQRFKKTFGSVEEITTEVVTKFLEDIKSGQVEAEAEKDELDELDDESPKPVEEGEKEAAEQPATKEEL